MHKLESRSLGERYTTLMAESEEELKNLLVRVKEESENSVFKKLRSWHPVPSLHDK